MKYLYILTPAVPRHDCHINSIVKDIHILHSTNLFENIEWYINIDNPTSKNFQFEDIRDSPQFIKGTVFMNHFFGLDISLDNKRDPEVIMRNEIFRPFVWRESNWVDLGLSPSIINDPSKTFKDKLTIVNQSMSQLKETTTLSNGMFGNVIRDIGDEWRDRRGFTKWNMMQKEHGIQSNENYTYN